MQLSHFINVGNKNQCMLMLDFFKHWKKSGEIFAMLRTFSQKIVKIILKMIIFYSNRLLSLLAEMGGHEVHSLFHTGMDL